MNKIITYIFTLTSFFVYTQQKQEVFTQNTKAILIENGRQAYFKKDTVSLNKITDEVFSLYIKTKDSSLLAKFYHFKALQNKLSYTNDSAFFYYHKSKNISKFTKDSLNVGRRLLSIANLQRGANDFLGSEISSIEALVYLEPIEAYNYLENIYNNLGLVSKELNQIQEAINYHNNALEINKKTKNKKNYLFIINNLGLLYQKQNFEKKAIEYFKKGLGFNSIKSKYPENYALLLENLTLIESNKSSKRDILSTSNNFLSRFFEVLSIRKKENILQSVSTTHLNISNYYYRDLNQKEKARHHANEALKYAKETHNNKRWLDALELLSDLSTEKQSKQYLQEYIQLNDSLIQKERQLKNQFAKIRYETDKKEKENGLLKTENEKIEAEVTYQKQQTTIGWLLFIVSLLALGSSILFFLVRRRRLIYQNQLQKAQAREKERQQIAKSLHDEVAGDLRLLHQKLQKSQLLEEAQKLNEVKDNVRNLSHKLSSVSFKKVSFKDQVINLVSDYFEPNFRIIVTGINDQEWQEINTSIKRLLYLSIRESIQNCKKYAQASKMTIHFSIHKKNVFLSIEDNGIGFDTNTTKKGIGLQNLEERLEELNGTLTIESEPNNGTKTYIQIPINA